MKENLENAASIKTTEFVGFAGGTRLVLSCQYRTASDGWMFIGTVFSTIDVTVADPLDRDATARVVAAEFILPTHSLLTVFRFI